jgi:hypothetical protein
MRYVEQSKTEIFDHETSLIWQRAIAENITFDDAHAYAKLVSDGTGQSWRVPTIDELSSLLDRTRSFPASCFPDMPPLPFWSSSPYVGYPLFAWYVSFSDGLVDSGARGSDGAVRLVRDAIP